MSTLVKISTKKTSTSSGFTVFLRNKTGAETEFSEYPAKGEPRYDKKDAVKALQVIKSHAVLSRRGAFARNSEGDFTLEQLS